MDRNYDACGNYVEDGFCRYCRRSTLNFNNVCDSCSKIPLTQRSSHGDLIKDIDDLKVAVRSQLRAGHPR